MTKKQANVLETDSIMTPELLSILKRAWEDRVVLFTAEFQKKPVRVCEMQTESGRKAAWELFWKYGKKGLL